MLPETGCSVLQQHPGAMLVGLWLRPPLCLEEWRRISSAQEMGYSSREMSTRAGCEDHLEMSRDKGLQRKLSDTRKRLDLKVKQCSRRGEVGLML